MVGFPSKPRYEGGPAIERFVRSLGTELKIDWQKLKLYFVTSTDQDLDDGHIGYFAKSDSVNTAKMEMCSVMGLDAANVRVWDFYQSHKQKLLSNLDLTLEDEQILDEQLVSTQLTPALL